jgi:crotonobetaine/carnitine-CoA ligase
MKGAGTVSRRDVLTVRVPPLEERRRRIESEPLPASIGALLDEAAADAPEQLAWNFFESGETVTYGALRARVNALANGMARAGIRKGSHVGVMLPNVAAFPTTWLALARLGAVMVPLNIAYTPREVEYVVRNGDVAWLIVHDECLDAVAALEGDAALPPERTFVVGAATRGLRPWSELADGQPDAFTAPAPVGLDDVMNIQYTSGTTGFPKGCVLSHRYWLTIGKVNAWRDGRVYRRILAATPFFYMDPQWLLLMAFYQRGTFYAARRQSSSRFMSWVREHRIQFCLFPEIVYKQPPDPRDRDNDIVRVNVYGLHREIHAALEDRFDLVAREAFGMTECGSGLFMPIEATDMVGSGSCGRPSPFREARIVDESGAPVPRGGVGELQLRGPGMLQGYYRNPEATAAAFQDGWFRTGDLFRQDERGYFYIVGRIKDMIRRSGENIAAREVEAVLRGLPEVVEAAAVPVPDPVRGEEVKAYVVLEPPLTPQDLPPERIIAHCEANLARFKVPRYIAYTDVLPKTPSGKIAKKVLTQGVPDLRKDSYDRLEGTWL